MLRRGSLVVLALLGLVACATGPRVSPSLMPSSAMGQTRCRLAATQSTLLVTEWPASEKANLEAALPRGGVAVALHGCAMTVVPRCQLGGAYRFQRTTPSLDSLDISTADELWTKLPIGAAGLEAELARSGRLTVQTTIAGQHRLEGGEQLAIPATAECEGATHIVGAVSIGAFALSRSGEAKVSGRAEMARVGAGGSISESQTLVRAAGNPESCAATAAEGPDPNCASPVQVFLWPIPGRVEQVGPPGTVRTEIVAAKADTRWDIYVDDRAVCSTPCALWLEPNRPLALRSRPDLRKIELTAGLGEEAATAGAVQVRAHGLSQGKFATGLTFTALGGMGVVTGLALGGVGFFSDSREGLCTAGLSTLVPSALVTAGAIWLIHRAMPFIEIGPTGTF